MWVRSPVNSFGLRTSSSGLPDFECDRTSSRKARMADSSRAPTAYRVGACLGTSVVVGRPWSSQSFRPPLRIRQSLWPKSLNAQRA